MLVAIARVVDNRALLHTFEGQPVGGGTAGCVLAGRLSEVAGWRVLLLEAGGPPPLETYVPGFQPISFSPGYRENWGYSTVPQRYSSKNLVNQTAKQPQGRVLGGGSTVNGMMHTRGNRRDFDQWAALGNPGWDYLCSSLLHQGRGLPRLPTHTGDLKYLRLLLIFIMFSGYTQDLGGGDNNRHECQGLPRTRWARRHPGTTAALLRAFIQSGLDLGYSVIDYNGPEQLGELLKPQYHRPPGELEASSITDLQVLKPPVYRPPGELLKPQYHRPPGELLKPQYRPPGELLNLQYHRPPGELSLSITDLQIVFDNNKRAVGVKFET
ncbi:glucose dehydrogenase [FAD, quinone]-like [Homarus americanus]|uniref:glucose dehydrogenase [FAD, quinone]-like n=1 Tax=Homarus americanus TaxID=6706 RepID=UPI001C440D03|nr:glucose dehydrogenase [FAD, quinone]-like [Homarus americanus]